MSRKVGLEVGFDRYVLLTMEEAAKVAAILDGKPVRNSLYAGNERVYYLEDEDHYARLGFIKPELVVTETEAMERKAKADAA